MRISTLALAALLAGTGLTTAAAAAQKPQAAAPQGAPKLVISDAAHKPLLDLQAAVNAKNYSAIPGLVAAANAAAKTPSDRYVAAQLQLKAAAEQNDFVTAAASVNAMRASGVGQAAELDQLDLSVAQGLYNAKNYAAAVPLLQRVAAANPSNTDALLVLAESENSQGQPAAAVATIQRAIQIKAASGQPAPQDWYKRALGLGYIAKLPVANQLALEWVKAYPSTDSWRDSLRVLDQLSPAANNDQIDLMRLRRAAGVLDSQGEYARYAQLAADHGLPGEADMVINEGAAAGKLDKSSAAYKPFVTSVSGKVAADKASLSRLEATAAASPTGRPLVNTADAYLGYGDYAKAASLYRASLSKPGVDKDVVNLRLGIALARSGDKAGADAAFSAVTGPTADLARYWQVWNDRRA